MTLTPVTLCNANRRRIRASRGRRLLRQRGECLERPFAYGYETGGLRRVYLRGRVNILKRVLIHFAALNLGLLMRVLVGVGTESSRPALGLVFTPIDPLAATYQSILVAMVCVHDSSGHINSHAGCHLSLTPGV